MVQRIMGQFSLLFFILIAVFSTHAQAQQTQSNRRQTFCQRNRCLTCIGRYCTTTCRGTQCEECPLGNCCDGKICNICRGSKCCASEECNSCVNTCLDECDGHSTCHYDCFQKCLPHLPPDDTGIPKLSINRHTNNYVPVNVTTIINVTNTINNTNQFYNPIIVNTTNIYNATLNRTTYDEAAAAAAEGVDSFERTDFHPTPDSPKYSSNLNRFVLSNDSNPLILPKQNCCQVVHPETCDTKWTPSRCIIRRHSECSDLCIGQRMYIARNDSLVKDKCFFIGVAPYYYCGRYSMENCDRCFDCANCAQSEGCPARCRASIRPENQYNVFYTKINNTNNRG